MKNNDKEFLAQRIRSQYVEREVTEVDGLRALDRRVKLPANIFAYIFGTVGALVMGLGMSLAMKVIGDSMAAGIVLGCIGIGIVSINYTLYSKLLLSRRKKYQADIIALSDKIIGK